MKVFITGGTGFIGNHLINKLKNTDHEICLLVLENEKIPKHFPENIDIIRGNLSNIEKWEDQLEVFDATIHMAWQGLPDYSAQMSAINMMNSLKLYEKLVENKCKKIITTGSCWEYGVKKGKCVESQTPKCSNSFTSVKNSMNFIGSNICKNTDTIFIWTRLFYIYGPMQRSYSLIPFIVNKMREGENPEIKTPDNSNDFLYIEDAADAIIQIFEKCKKDNVFNIGSGKSIKIRDIVDIVGEIFDYKIKIPSARNDEEFVDFWADISKIKKEIGWQPNTNLKRGICKTIEYFNQTKKLLKEV